MSSFGDLFAQMPAWRKAAFVVLLGAGIVVWLASLVGQLPTAAIFGTIALCLCAGLVGPRSPFLR